MGSRPTISRQPQRHREGREKPDHPPGHLDCRESTYQPPAKGTGAALVMPDANTQAMQAHLAEIGRTVARGAHAVLLLDRAGWHTSSRLTIPRNITLLYLPARSPELNPVENVWQYLRQNHLSNRVFPSYETILEASCEAWNRLLEKPWKVMSIGLRQWAYEGQTQ